MIKDIGVARPDARGWVPVDQAMLATGRWAPDAPLTTFVADPIRVEGITTLGRIVEAVYWPTGDYSDQWRDPSGRVRFKLTHVRPLR